jgi:hypothetical protein
MSGPSRHETGLDRSMQNSKRYFPPPPPSHLLRVSLITSIGGWVRTKAMLYMVVQPTCHLRYHSGDNMNACTVNRVCLHFQLENLWADFDENWCESCGFRRPLQTRACKFHTIITRTLELVIGDTLVHAILYGNILEKFVNVLILNNIKCKQQRDSWMRSIFTFRSDGEN